MRRPNVRDLVVAQRQRVGPARRPHGEQQHVQRLVGEMGLEVVRPKPGLSAPHPGHKA